MKSEANINEEIERLKTRVQEINESLKAPPKYKGYHEEIFQDRSEYMTKIKTLAWVLYD